MYSSTGNGEQHPKSIALADREARLIITYYPSEYGAKACLIQREIYFRCNGRTVVSRVRLYSKIQWGKKKQVQGTSSAEVCEVASVATAPAIARGRVGRVINLRVIIFFALARALPDGYESELKRVESANPCRSTYWTKPNELHSFMNNRGAFFRPDVLCSHVEREKRKIQSARERRNVYVTLLVYSSTIREQEWSSRGWYINPRELGERRKKESARSSCTRSRVSLIYSHRIYREASEERRARNEQAWNVSTHS